MAQNKTEPAYLQVMEISDMVQSISHKRQIVTEEYSGAALRRKPTKDQAVTLMVKMEFAQMNLGIYNILSPKAYAFVAVHIMPKLKMYNMLWHHPVASDGNTKQILAELRRERIIFRTEVAGIYLVNPVMCWRGTIHSAVECTKKLLRANGKKPSLELIRDLRPGDKIERYQGQELLNKLAGRDYGHDPDAPLQLENEQL